MPDPYYITTPIYYPSGEPHLGHVYTTTCADIVARYFRLVGRDTFFLTGTDEHGIKMVKEAAKKNVEPGALGDRYSAMFRDAFERMRISNDDFIRTVEPRHERAVSRIVQTMLDKGDIYLGSYEGWYDEGEENFVTETEARANDYKSPISGRALTRMSEPTYFFRLSKYASRVAEHIRSTPGFLAPESRRSEVLSKLTDDIADLSISRSSLTWGVPMPNDPGHVLYVWIDALSNYITALGYGSDDPSRFDRYWSASHHLIGKEILWFHAVYWPAMLISLELPLPKKLFAHGWWTVEGEKMSKSLDNFIGLDELATHAERYSLDGLRYYLLRAAPFGNDLNFSGDELQRAYDELARVVGNLLNRVVNMTHKYRSGVVPEPKAPGVEDAPVEQIVRELPNALATAYDELALQDAATAPVEVARAGNLYIDQTQPFKLAKDASQSDRLDTVLHWMIRSVHASLVGLLPICPTKAAEGLAQLGVSVEGRTLDDLLQHPPAPGSTLGEPTPLFPRLQ